MVSTNDANLHQIYLTTKYQVGILSFFHLKMPVIQNECRHLLKVRCCVQEQRKGYLGRALEGEEALSPQANGTSKGEP